MEELFNTVFKSTEQIGKVYSMLQPLVAERSLGQSPESVGNEVTSEAGSVFQNLLDTHNADLLKKMSLVALSVHQKQTGQEQALSDNVVSTVDDAVELIQVAYDVATGRMDAYTAADHIVDRVTVRALVFAEAAIDRGVPIAVDRLCTAIVVSKPELAPLVPVIKNLSQIITPHLKKMVSTGIKAIAKVAKPVVAKAIQHGQSVFKKVSNSIRSLATA